MTVQVILVDVNPRMVAAWRETFEDNLEVAIVHGSMLEQDVDAWVWPIDAAGRGLEGSLDGALVLAVQAQIAERHGGLMPVGHASCVETGRPTPRFLISTAVPDGAGEDASAKMNVVLAAAAALQAVHAQNTKQPGSIASVALPAIGTASGRVAPQRCADLMWTAYDLFRTGRLTDEATMRSAIEGLLHDLERTIGKDALDSSYKATLPDSAAAQAQLERQLEKARRDARDGGSDDREE